MSLGDTRKKGRGSSSCGFEELKIYGRVSALKEFGLE